MKKEEKRYFLVRYYVNKRSKTVDTLEEVKYLINEVRKYNNRKSSEFLFGNITVDKVDGQYVLTAHLYKKYTDRCTISEIDNITSKYTENELIEHYKDKSMMREGFKPDINIAYLETSNKDENGNVKYERGIKYIPVLYKDDLKYIDEKYIQRCLYYHASTKDYDFFKELCKEFSPHHFISDEISDLLDKIDKCEKQRMDLTLLFISANKLFKKFIREYDKDESLSRNKNGEYIISRRRLRDFGLFIKYFNIRDSKRKSPLIYNCPLPEPEYLEEENGQLKLRLI